MDFVASLSRLAGSRRDAASMVESVASDLMLAPDFTDRTLLALAMCLGGKSPDEVASLLTWREFESFCSKLFMASGYDVRENIVLRKPRAQIDIVAFGPSHLLSVDCKHWKRGHSPSRLQEIAQGQLSRSARLRRTLTDSRPIVSVILSFSEPSGSFVDGVAVVPIRTLRDFLISVDSYSELLEFM